MLDEVCQPRQCRTGSDGITDSPPQRFFKQDGKRVDWTPEQYDRLQAMTGQSAKPQLDALVQSPAWEWMDDDQRKDEVGGVMKKARGDAKAAILSALVGSGGGTMPMGRRDPVAAALVGSR